MNNSNIQGTYTVAMGDISVNSAANIPAQSAIYTYGDLVNAPAVPIATTQHISCTYLYLSEERLREIIREELTAALSIHATVETENNDQPTQAE